MSERKLEVGAYVRIENYSPRWDGQIGVVTKLEGKLAELDGQIFRFSGLAEFLTPCDPPADSPLGRAEARVRELEAKCLELKRVLQEHGIQWPEGFTATKERSENA